MNPASNEMPGISLPAPAEQQPATPGAPAESAAPPSGPERHLVNLETASNAAAAQAVPTAPPPTMSAAGAATQTDDSSTTKSTTSKVLKDDDLIEKEWVNRAKQIVERTRNDPHRQSEELTLVKADYMKKRYNKSIKVDK